MSILPSILTFNFYIDQVICDKIYKGVEGLVPASGIIFKRKACYNPTFFDQLWSNITENTPELVVITTQGKAGYFHTDFLPNHMRYYDLLDHKQYKEVNISIYCRADLEDYEIDNYYYSPDDMYTNVLTLYVNSSYGRFKFIGLNRQETEINDDYVFDQLNERAVNIDDNANYYFLMGHVLGPNRLTCKQLNQEFFTQNYTYYGNMDGHYDIYETDCNIISHEPLKEIGIMNNYQLKDKNIKVLCFSWNTDKIPLCDQYYNPGTKKHYREKLWYKDECYNPLFFEEIKARIEDNLPNIVVISNEGDLKSGTFFHAQFLRTSMKKLGYSLLDNSKANDIGDNETLRLSIYINNQNFSLQHINKSLISYNEEYTCSLKTPSGHVKAKAIVKYVNTRIGIIAFMALQMPHLYASETVNQCLKEMEKKLLNPKVSYVFTLGDFSLPAGSNTDNKSLKNYYKKKLPALETYNEGPYIQPNYKFKRISGDYQKLNDLLINNELTKDQYNMMTWHNRIYYKTMGLTTHDIDCLSYELLFGFPMLLKGEHLGVVGIYEFDQPRPEIQQSINESDSGNMDERNYIEEDDFEASDTEGILQNVFVESI